MAGKTTLDHLPATKLASIAACGMRFDMRSIQDSGGEPLTIGAAGN